MKLKFVSFCSSCDALSYGILFGRSQIFQFMAKTVVYSPWFDFCESEKYSAKRIPSERASQEEQNGTNFSSVAPSSEE